MFIYQRSNNLTVSKPGQTSLVQQERTAKRADCSQFIKPPDLPQKMLPKQLAISSPGFGGYFKYQIPGIRAINYLAPIDIFSCGIFGILISIIQHLFQLSCMHIYY
jgi:hypothetical protein